MSTLNGQNGHTPHRKHKGHRVTAGTSYEPVTPCNPENTCNPVTSCNPVTDVITCECDPCNPVTSVRDAVEAAIPSRPLQYRPDYRAAVFKLARHLKAVESVKDKKAAELKPAVEEWYERSSQFLGDISLADVRSEFSSCWKGVKFPAGDSAVKLAWEIVKAQPLPKEAEEYDDRLGLLISLCRQLQRENEKDDSFFLAGRTIGMLFGVDQRAGSAWMTFLVDEGILEELPYGPELKARRKAKSYRVLVW